MTRRTGEGKIVDATMTEPKYHSMYQFMIRHRNVVMATLGIVIGLFGGLGAVFFRYLITWVQQLIYFQRGDLSEIISSLPWWKTLLGPAIGGAVVGPVIYLLAKEAKGHGVPEVMNAVATEGGVIRARVVFVKTLASAVCIGSGGSVGREGPIVQIGSALGSSFGQILRLPVDQMRILVGCGAAAGIAATFNAPMAGAVFALEIILADFTLSTFVPIVLSSVAATAVSRHFLGDFPAFKIPQYALASPFEFGLYLVMGLLAGVVAVTFTTSLYKSEDLWDSLKVPEYVKAAMGGIVIGCMGLLFPQIMGLGYGTIEKTLLGQDVWTLLVLLLPLKILATSITIGSGGSGGILAPSLFMGAMTGAAFGCAAHWAFPGHTAEPAAYAVVGMGAVVAGTTHAPFQAFLILFELTQDYRVMPALMICCVISAAVARRFNTASIYTLKLLRRGVDIRAGRDVNLLKSLHVKDFMTWHPETLPQRMLLREMIGLFQHSRHTSFPVTDDEGNLVGMVFFKDFRELAFEESVHDVVVAKDIAIVPAPSVTPDDSLAVALTLINETGMGSLPVVRQDKESRKVVGILSQRDILSAYDKALEARGLKELLGGSKQ